MEIPETLEPIDIPKTCYAEPSHCRNPLQRALIRLKQREPNFISANKYYVMIQLVAQELQRDV
jgi:hypothetical protein